MSSTAKITASTVRTTARSTPSTVAPAPNTSGNKLGVAHRGDVLNYQGVTSNDGWNLIEYNGQNGWVSGRYSEFYQPAGIREVQSNE